MMRVVAVLLCSALLCAAAVAYDHGDVSMLGESALKDLDRMVVSSQDLLGEMQDPPTTAEAAGPVAAINEPVAEAASSSGNATADAADAKRVVLPPPIFGGTEGDFLFKVQANLPAAAVTELGESASVGATTDQTSVDKSYRSLFDLKPLFMGIQADIHRRRALLGGVCIMSLRDMVYDGICKKGHATANGGCSLYSVPPMTVAMQTLFKNAQTNFCKFNATGCDATMCYTYGGPVAPETGLPQASHHVMKDTPIWVHVHNKEGNGTAVPTDTVVTQLITIKMSLEKAVFCEKMEPPQQTPEGHVKVMNCHTSRRCQMLSLERGKCQLASSDTEPAPQTACPTDVEFVKAVEAKEGDLTTTLCSTL